MRETFDELLHINDTKGHDYAGEDNALANFQDEAKVIGVEPEVVWAVFAGKHWRAIMTFCKEGDVASEPIEGRVHDLIMYGFLLLGIIEAKKRATVPSGVTGPCPAMTPPEYGPNSIPCQREVGHAGRHMVNGGTRDAFVWGNS